MSLPSLIEIVPLESPIEASVVVPGSKSITNRALLLAALSEGTIRLKGALWSEDTQVMTEALRTLGFEVGVEEDASESCNRTISVCGAGGELPRAGTPDKPLELHVGNAGTAARFLTALCCLGRGSYRLHGVPRMHERPQGPLFRALQDLGYQIDAESDHLPVVIHGAGPRRGGRCTIGVGASSQFASALLLVGRAAGWSVDFEAEVAAQSPYVAMTQRLLNEFPSEPGEYAIEPDASSGSYIWAAGWLCATHASRAQEAGKGRSPVLSVKVSGWPASGWQIDEAFPEFLPLPSRISREDQLGDSIMTAIVLSADEDAARGWGWSGEEGVIRFTDLGRLRVQECERVHALRAELTKCGGRVEEEGDTLIVHPSRLHGAEISTYNDHRMAMCFATLGLKVPGIRIQNPSCVKKTFPNFFQKLAAAPPRGLGVTVLDGATGQPLKKERLFAE